MHKNRMCEVFYYNKIFDQKKIIVPKYNKTSILKEKQSNSIIHKLICTIFRMLKMVWT